MNFTDFAPVGEMVLVREIEEDHVRPSGLILTTDLNRYSKEGEVVATGAGEVNQRTGKREEVQVEIGDRVFYTAYAGVATWREEDENYTLVKERDILAIKVGD